jgi:hypothetical protein
MVSIGGHINYRGPPSVAIGNGSSRSTSVRCFESYRAADVVQHLICLVDKRDLRSKPTHRMEAMCMEATIWRFRCVLSAYG